MAPSKQDNLSAFEQSFLAFQIDRITREADAALEQGLGAREILGACQRCMETIGQKFDAGEYYLPELVVAGEMFKGVSEVLQPHLASSEATSSGVIVLGTPQGDIHNLGKDIFGVLAEADGFAVHDLGVDVPPAAFLEKIEETGAPILGLSALVTAAFAPMEEILRLLEEKGIRKKVRVLLGGGVTTAEMARRLGADAQTHDAYEGLKIARSLMKKATVKARTPARRKR